MKITSYKNLTSFNFWSGAKVLAEKLTYTELDRISDALSVLYFDGMTDTQINDLFWFEEEFICGLIGLDYEQVLDRD